MQIPSKVFRDRFFGAPYKFGGQSKEDGFDCLSFTKNYYEELGKEVPIFADLYPMYKDNPAKVKRLMWKRLFKCTVEVPINQIQPGDLIIFKHEEFGSYPGIWLGNGNLGASFSDTGVTVVNSVGVELLSARRWRD